jgi:hypothetical protein
MVKVRIEILPGLSENFGGKGFETVSFFKEVNEGSTIIDIINILSIENQTFNNFIIDNKTNKIKPGIFMILNDQLLDLSKEPSIKVKNGDIIKLFPLLDGG